MNKNNFEGNVTAVEVGARKVPCILFCVVYFIVNVGKWLYQ